MINVVNDRLQVENPPNGWPITAESGWQEYNFFFLERHLGQVPWSLSVLSLSLFTTSRLAPWTRRESNRG